MKKHFARWIWSTVSSKPDDQTSYGLYKAEVIHKKGPWKNLDQVELATVAWVEWFNNRRLYSVLGYVSPAEYEEFFNQQTESAHVA